MNNTSKTALTCATIEPASPTLAGNTTVLFVLARLENAFTYCSATLSVAALSPNWNKISELVQKCFPLQSVNRRDNAEKVPLLTFTPK